MVKIAVASKNPVKINACKKAFSEYFEDVEVLAFSVPSNVSPQPMSLEETYKGAVNRAKNLKKEVKDADFYLGLESGIMKINDNFALAGGVVAIIDKKDRLSFALTPYFPLPKKVMDELNKGKELGDVMKEMIKRDVKQKEGAIGVFSRGKVTREDLFVPAIISALLPFLNEELYFG